MADVSDEAAREGVEGLDQQALEARVVTVAPGIDSRQFKKQKTAQKAPMDTGRCEYIIQNKNRRCGMQIKKGQKLCTQHLDTIEDSGRVPCPVDPLHTILKKNLDRHIKKCTSREKHDKEVWYQHDFNNTLHHSKDIPEVDDSENETAFSSDQEYLRYHIAHVQNLEDYEPLTYKIESHSGLDQRLAQVEHQKHPIQQSSLVGNLKARGQLGIDHFYVEFGCGKAELSRFLNLCVLKEVQAQKPQESVIYGFGFIDRGINRMKNDPKIMKETAGFNKDYNSSVNPQIKRTRIDIKDLDLTKFLQECHYNSVVAISKHLCGVATDLTLKSILNSNLLETGKFGGMLIAMCCRHVCDYDQLLPQSKEFLHQRGITKSSFKALQRFVSWAVSGPSTASDNLPSSTDSLTGMTIEQRKQLGLKSRRLIDESRLYAVKQLVPHNYHCELFWYVKPQVTVENVCLSITKINP